MQSLAEYLGTKQELSAQDTSLASSRLLSPEKLTAVEFAEAVLNSQEFRTYVVSMLALGELPPAITTRLMDYAWGKPVERFEVKDTTPSLESLSEEQLEERAMQLAEMARQMREARESTKRSPDSIH